MSFENSFRKRIRMVSGKPGAIHEIRAVMREATEAAYDALEFPDMDALWLDQWSENILGHGDPFASNGPENDILSLMAIICNLGRELQRERAKHADETSV